MLCMTFRTPKNLTGLETHSVFSADQQEIFTFHSHLKLKLKVKEKKKKWVAVNEFVKIQRDVVSNRKGWTPFGMAYGKSALFSSEKAVCMLLSISIIIIKTNSPQQQNHKAKKISHRIGWWVCWLFTFAASGGTPMWIARITLDSLTFDTFGF